MTLALIDADTIYYKAAFKLNKKDIRESIDWVMKDIEGQLFMPYMRTAVKGWGNFRKDMYPKYKSNRPPIEQKLKDALNYGHQYMIDKYEAVQADGMEADDLVSIWAYEARELELDYWVVGIDKDLRQIPGNHYNFGKRTWEFIDDDQANYNLMFQCLTGDNSDNIPGIKGIGPKKAEKILKDIPMERRWNRVCASWRANAAGDPSLSLRLLSMVKTWEELDDIQSQISSKTSKREQDVQPKREDDVQVS